MPTETTREPAPSLRLLHLLRPLRSLRRERVRRERRESAAATDGETEPVRASAAAPGSSVPIG